MLSTVDTKSRKPTRASAGVIGGGSCAGGRGVVWGVVEAVLILILGKFVVAGSGFDSGSGCNSGSGVVSGSASGSGFGTSG